MPRSEYRSEYSPPPPPRRSGARVVEYEETDVQVRRDKRGARERDYLRDAYERTDDRNGELVLREDIEEGSVRGERRGKEYRDEEIVIARSGKKDRDRPRRREVEEEIRIRERDAEGSVRSRSLEEEDTTYSRRRSKPIEHEEVREEVVYRPRRDRNRDRDRDRDYVREEITEEWIPVPRDPPVVAREVEEWRFAPKPRERRRDVVDETVIIKQRERERSPEPAREEVINIRERDVSRKLRDEEINIREYQRERPRDYSEEEIRIRQRERPNDYHEEDVRIRERETDRGYRDEEIRISERDRGSGYRDEEIRISERDRGPGYRDEEIRIQERTREDRRERPSEVSSDHTRRAPRDDYDEEEIIIKRNEREGTSGRTDEIVIRRKERSISPAPAPAPAPSPPPPPPELEPIRAPPIHREIITHHRHIDHGKDSIYLMY